MLRVSAASARLSALRRVSSDGQVDGYGLESQERAIRAWTRGSGHALTRVVRDAGVSGATDALDQPGLADVLQALSRDEADGLVVARLDTGARADGPGGHTGRHLAEREGGLRRGCRAGAAG